MNNDSLYKILTPEEEREYRQWARDNYKPGLMKIETLWHPIIKNECAIMMHDNRIVTIKKKYKFEVEKVHFINVGEYLSIEDAWRHNTSYFKAVIENTDLQDMDIIGKLSIVHDNQFSIEDYVVCKQGFI